MDKITYLAELAEGLARWVPERERQDILRYYAEYFEEAGPEREAEVIQELGDPWALSCRLAVEGGYVTQEQADGWTPPRKKRWPWVLAVCAVLVVALISSLMTALVALGQWAYRTAGPAYVTAVDEATTAEFGTASYDAVEEGTGTVVFNGGVAYIDGEEYAEGSFAGFWSMEDGFLEAFESIDVDISFGNVVVTGGIDYTLAIQPEGDLGGYELKWEVTNGTLKIQDAKRGGFQVGFSGLTGKHSLDVIITVPDTMLTMLERIDVETDLGDVFLGDVFVREKLEAKTALGDVECYEVRVAKKLTLKSDLGDVTLGIDELYDGMAIDLETNLGNVEASLGCYEEECGYELGTDLGKVTVNGVSRGDKAEQKGNYPYKLDAESDQGNVNVYFYDSQWQ